MLLVHAAFFVKGRMAMYLGYRVEGWYASPLPLKNHARNNVELYPRGRVHSALKLLIQSRSLTLFLGLRHQLSRSLRRTKCIEIRCRSSPCSPH